MPTAERSINIVMQDATGATAVRGYSEMIILGEDGHKIETATPRGIAAQPDDAQMVLATVNIDGISQFAGLTNSTKTLVYTHTGTTMGWDSGTGVDVSGNGTFTLYDSDDNNFILITVTDASQMTGDRSDVITVQDGVLANAITVLELEDELLTAAPVITDADAGACSAGGTYPRPTSALDYAIYATDKKLLAIKNQVGSTDLSVDYSIYKIAREYASLTSVDADHKADTEISKAAAKMFANGARSVHVMNTYDGSTEQYALCLTELQTQNYDYDIMVPTVDVEDANFVLCSTHAITYTKIIIAPMIGTASVVRAAMATLTTDEVQYGICYDDTTYTEAELAGAAAAIIAQKSPWIPCEWGSVTGINAAGYSKDDLHTLEGTSTTLRVNTFIQVGTYTVLSSGRALKAGTWLDIPRTKQYLKDAIQDAWVTAKLQLANSNKKVPYTQAGLNLVETIIRKPLKRAQKAGALREDSYDSMSEKVPGFVISMPLIEDIPGAYKTARQLPDVSITAYLSGAIETIDPMYLIISLGEV